MKKLLSLLLSAVMLISCGAGLAFAEAHINNQIKGGEGNIVSGTPVIQENGLELILSTGDQYTVTMPNPYSYITPVSMYVDAPADHSIYVYRGLECDREKLMPFAYEGMRVTAVAEQSNGQTALTCIVYRDEDYRLRAGWVHSKYLTGWFPGAVETVGRAWQGNVLTARDPVLNWARDYFVNTRQKYTVLSEPVRACTQFKLNYQVTGRGGVSTDSIVGPRTVYVNDGSGWTEAGSFDYPKIQSVLVTVNLPEPTDLLAVAVIPSCKKPDRFIFRQAVEDVLTAGTGSAIVDSQSPESGSAVVIFEGGPAATPVPTPAAHNIRRGNLVTFGAYEQDLYRKGGREPIEWIVLDVQGDNLFLVSRYALDCGTYCSRQESVAWETSRLRSWLNDQFLKAAFTDEEQMSILVTEVDNSRSQGYIHYQGDGGNNTLDRIFLLSYAEAWTYFYQSSDRACKPTKVAVKRGVFESSLSGNCPWWLRSPGYTTDYVAAVDVDGNRGGNVKYGAMGVRPALWVQSGAVRLYGKGR